MRQTKIRDIVQERGSIRVDELSSLFDVSDITIRRDLDYLEKRGVLERTHGGAVCTEHIRTESLYSEKDRLLAAEKEAIGKAAAGMVEDGDTLLINSGSTTYQVIPHIQGRQNLRIITNNVTDAVSLREKDRTEIILTGGLFRPESHSLIGPFASRILSDVYGSKAILGVDGLSIKSGMTSPVYQEANITRTMLERTQGRIILTADHSKIGRVTSFVIAPISHGDVLVTDSGFNEEFRPDLEENGMTIVKAPVS